MANECELLEGINLESGFRSLPRSGLVQRPLSHSLAQFPVASCFLSIDNR
jgi:hypothetical protein